MVDGKNYRDIDVAHPRPLIHELPRHHLPFPGDVAEIRHRPQLPTGADRRRVGGHRRCAAAGGEKRGWARKREVLLADKVNLTDWYWDLIHEIVR